MNRIQSVVVTGGSGRIGKRLTKQLLDKGYKVRVADMVPSAYPEAEFIQTDITNYDDMVNATQDMDAIVHLAAIPVENGKANEIFRVNMEGTFNALDASAKNGVKGFVFASSVVAYACLNPSQEFVPAYLPIDEETELIPDKNYSAGKVAAEAYMKSYSRLFGMDGIALRLATVMNPGAASWKGAVENINNPEYVFPGGITMRQFMWQYLHVFDVAQAFVLAIEYLNRNEKIGFDAFNIGAKDCSSNVPTLDLIAKYYPNVPVLKHPGDFIRNSNETLYSIRKAQQILGYNPQYTWRDWTAEV